MRPPLEIGSCSVPVTRSGFLRTMSVVSAPSAPPVAYLGPEGSFSHLVARQRYQDRELVPFKTIPEVFDFLNETQESVGVVPIENSSGGTIMPTVDGLIENACRLYVEEELSLDVKLALLGRRGAEINTVYSHFAPLQHCGKWLKKHYPRAREVATPSTSGAVQLAAGEADSAAIGRIENAEMYGLEVLSYPIADEIPNVTQFFVIGHHKATSGECRKTSLVVALRDEAGSLCSFLTPFREAAVSLKRIQSRPIVGHPNTYMFFIEVDGCEADQNVQQALTSAAGVASSIESLGSYPVKPRYTS